MRAQARRIQERFPTETAGTCSTCVGKSNKIGVSNRRANGPLMQLNVNFNGSRRLEQCPWIVATDAQCDGQVPLLPKKFRPGPEAIPEGPVVLDVTEAACAMDASGAFTAAPISAATRLYRSARRTPAVPQPAFR